VAQEGETGELYTKGAKLPLGGERHHGLGFQQQHYDIHVLRLGTDWPAWPDLHTTVFYYGWIG
jgi:hypothetical protein